MNKASFTRFLIDALMPAAARCQEAPLPSSARTGAIAFVCTDWRHMAELLALARTGLWW